MWVIERVKNRKTFYLSLKYVTIQKQLEKLMKNAQREKTMKTKEFSVAPKLQLPENN